MTLSIIIPIYKVEKYIKDCLNSIVNQLDDDMEVILVNDGTPDNSMDIALDIASNDKHFKVINQENQGLSNARNNGLALAEGEFVWFVDSDDWLLENSIFQVQEIINENKSIDVIATALLFSYENGAENSEYHPTSGRISGKKYLQMHYRQGAIQRFIFNKEFLDKNNLLFKPNILHEDSLFGFEMLYLAEDIYILPTPIYGYRIRNCGSIMSSISIKSAYDLLNIHKELSHFCDNKVKVEDRDWYKLAIYNTIDCIFGFCRNILATNAFRLFYKSNKAYIKHESKFLLLNKDTFFYGIRMYFFPISYMKFKVFLKKILSNDYKKDK